MSQIRWVIKKFVDWCLKILNFEASYWLRLVDYVLSIFEYPAQFQFTFCKESKSTKKKSQKKMKTVKVNGMF